MARELESITESEWRVMEVLWRDGPQLMAQIVASLEEETKWSRTTVLTLAGRLEKKGYIGTERSSRAYTYIPLVRRKEARRAELERFVNQIYAGDSYQLVRQLTDIGAISRDDLKRLGERLESGGKSRRKNRKKNG
ncbi:MAG: BlaI/MecI/CopY family transcriptional regulator [Bacillota bacterium]|nr:BlaI/MecI/CopY family transcriptional regulator [Bacillota bacterium]